MTKARARERAKAKRLQKPKKRETQEVVAENQQQATQSDPKTHTIKGPGKNNNAGNFGSVRRGAARSK